MSWFGIAKALQLSRTGAPGGTLTQIGTSIGAPAYMAPEQAAGDDVDHRADLFAWGVMAYELLAGAHPFAGKTSAQQLIAAHIAETPAGDIALRAIAEDWSGALPLTRARRLVRRPSHATWLDSLDQDGSRAVVLAHLGRVGEARAAEARIALQEGRSWNIGAPSLWRARIAAHLGETARAAELAEQAVRRGGLRPIGGLYTIDSDPFLVPLRDVPRFRELAKPLPEDGH